MCGGSGTRSGLNYNKVFYPLGQKNVFETVVDRFLSWDKIVVVINKHNMHDLVLPIHNDCVVIEGGDTRAQSAYNGLRAAKGCDLVAIHDGARPFISDRLIDKLVQHATKFNSAVPALKVTDSIKTAHDNKVVSTVKKDNLFSVQTPQIFKHDQILAAYEMLMDKGIELEDDSDVYLRAGFSPHIIEGEATNKKLTHPSDFLPVHATKIGTGFDVHQLADDRPLILGGVTIPYHKGLDGHSDADVLTHAIMDALLSSAGHKDIGHLFPDNDNSFKDANSIELLKKVMILLKEQRITIKHVSATIIAQAPKLAPYLDEIKAKLASVLKLKHSSIGILATTTEFMGIVGEGAAIAASAVCLCD